MQAVSVRPDGHWHANAAQTAIYVTSVQTLLANEALQSETFGPASVVVKASHVDESLQIAQQLEGQLTATLHLEQGDYDSACALLPVLERKCGRILVNGFPTGVEVSQAMVHGGSIPTFNAMYTSVGASAIDRLLRPVCYQDLPDALRPVALQNENASGVWRLVDGAPSSQGAVG